MGRTLKCMAALAMLACSIGIAACGGGGDDESALTSGSSDLSGTVTIWDTEYETLSEYTKAIDQLDAEFEELHPAVQIDRQAQPLEGYEAVVRAAFTAQQGPDLMAMQAGAAGVLTFAPGLEPLNDLLSSELQEDLTQWDSVTPGFSAEGDRYGVPVGVVGFVFYYNKELFAKAGLPTDFQPESWAEVREAGETLKAAGIQPFTGGNKEGLESGWWFSAGFHTQSSPEQAQELATGELDYTDEAVTKAYEPMLEMQEAGLYPDDRASTPLLEEGFARFAGGEGAMVLGLWNAIGYWGEFNPKLGEENVGMFFAPGATSVETFAAFAMSIPTFADNKDSAVALLEFQSTEAAMKKLYEVGGLMPNRRDFKLPADAPIQAQELVGAAQEQETTLAPLLMVPGSVIFGPMSAEFNQVLLGRASLESAQQTMQEVSEKANQ